MSNKNNIMERIDVLDKVKKVDYLLYKNEEVMTTEMVCDYFGSKKETIRSLIKDHKEELVIVGYAVLVENELKEFKREWQIKSKARGIAIFKKRTVLNIAMILKDNNVANNIKKELGISLTSNLHLRKEIKFKKHLDNVVESIRKEMINNISAIKTSELYSDIIKAIDSQLSYETQYCVCNKYKIDFYFYRLNIAIEYDECHHLSNIQKSKDKTREYEIIRDIYIKKYYSEVDEETMKNCDVCNKNQLFDMELEEGLLEHNYDITKFVRIDEENETLGIIEITTNILYKLHEKIKNRGMSCNYQDLC